LEIFHLELNVVDCFGGLLIDVFWCLHYFIFVKRGWYVRRRKVKCKAIKSDLVLPESWMRRSMRAREVKNPAFVVVKRQFLRLVPKI